MSIITMVMTDGRQQYLVPALKSLQQMVSGPVTRRVLHDDSGDPEFRGWLRRQYPGWEVIGTPQRSGFCAAYASAFAWLARQPESWVFQTEDDFTYETEIDLTTLIDVMDANPHLVQMQLRRQPWGTEPADGGFVGQWPHFYTDASDGIHYWLEHRRNWSTNPGLFRQGVCQQPWPDPPGCEGTFGDRIIERDPDLRFALWGRREDPPAVQHIGHERIGFAY